jgi:ComF family protein
VYRFKYEDSPELAPRLAQLLAERASQYLEKAQGEVCAIPLHPSRRRKRRYDQSQLLARALAKAQSRPFLSGALRRTVSTRPQVGLSLAEREQNVADAFWADPGVEGKSLLVVDDVLTTSATARAAARALREKGAEKVYILAFARASLG